MSKRESECFECSECGGSGVVPEPGNRRRPMPCVCMSFCSLPPEPCDVIAFHPEDRDVDIVDILDGSWDPFDGPRPYPAA